MENKIIDNKLDRQYAKSLLKKLLVGLSQDFGKGFSVDIFENMRKFYITYFKSEILSRGINSSWFYYIFLTISFKEELFEKELCFIHFLALDSYSRGLSKTGGYYVK